MITRNAHARWEGSLKDGNGTLEFGDGLFRGPYSFLSRFQDGEGTNPEELLGAAHAGCFSMALSMVLGKAGYTPDSLDTTASVTIAARDGGFAIIRSHLECTARVPDLDARSFAEYAEKAKADCPVSRALAGTEITLVADLR